MKRIVVSFLIGYTILGVVTRAMEAAGRFTCECEPDCWCKRPGLSIYRWVFPRFHHCCVPDGAKTGYIANEDLSPGGG